MVEQEKKGRIRPVVELCEVVSKAHGISIGQAADLLQDLGEWSQRLLEGQGSIGDALESLKKAPTKGVQ